MRDAYLAFLLAASAGLMGCALWVACQIRRVDDELTGYLLFMCAVGFAVLAIACVVVVGYATHVLPIPASSRR